MEGDAFYRTLSGEYSLALSPSRWFSNPSLSHLKKPWIAFDLPKQCPEPSMLPCLSKDISFDIAFSSYFFVAAALMNEDNCLHALGVLIACYITHCLHLCHETFTCPVSLMLSTMLLKCPCCPLYSRLASLSLLVLRGVTHKYPSCSSTKSATIMPLPFIFGKIAGQSSSPASMFALR